MTSTDQTNRMGIHAVGAALSRLGWAFREQPTSDFGVDAQAEKLEGDGSGTGKLIALQIKTGPSYFIKRADGFVYYGKQRHRHYWTNYALPVFLIIHDPVSGLTLWQRVTEDLIEPLSNGRWAIQIPSDQVLDQKNAHFLERGIAADFSSMRRYRLALDLPLIHRFAEEDEIYLRIENWVNKSLNFRKTDVVFSEDCADHSEMILDTWLPAYTLERFMDYYFPWLEWKLHSYIDESEGAYEVAIHILKVSLNTVGKSTLILDKYYQRDLVSDARPAIEFDPEFFLEIGENDQDQDDTD